MAVFLLAILSFQTSLAQFAQEENIPECASVSGSGAGRRFSGQNLFPEIYRRMNYLYSGELLLDRVNFGKKDLFNERQALKLLFRQLFRETNAELLSVRMRIKNACTVLGGSTHDNKDFSSMLTTSLAKNNNYNECKAAINSLSKATVSGSKTVVSKITVLYQSMVEISNSIIKMDERAKQYDSVWEQWLQASSVNAIKAERLKVLGTPADNGINPVQLGSKLHLQQGSVFDKILRRMQQEYGPGLNGLKILQDREEGTDWDSLLKKCETPRLTKLPQPALPPVLLAPPQPAKRR